MNFCPNTGQKLYIKENKCNVCGNTNITKNDIFCNICGNKLVDIITKDEPKKEKIYIGGNIITHLFAILFVLLGLVAGVGALISGSMGGILCIVISAVLGWLFFIFPNK
jgi:uncharacterized membrane protein YvbJ